MNHNTLVVTGTPSLVTGSLTVDSDQALSFNGSTNSAAAADSASLSITGSMSIELFLRLAAYPGAQQAALAKASSYALYVNPAGTISFGVFNSPASGVATSNVSLSLNTWYHIVCVYNGNYSGIQQFGKATLGASSAQVDDDNGNNKSVSRFTLPETALLNSVSTALEYNDEVWDVRASAVVYADSGGVPGALVTQSDMQVLRPPTPAWRSWTWVPFPLHAAVVPAGTYYLGYISDTVADIPKAPLIVSCDVTGGYRAGRPDGVGSPSDPFGTVSVTDAALSSIYCNYTAVSRTGREGKVLIYINGALNSSAVYSGGIADTANTLQVCPSLAAQVDEASIWDKALSDGQIATHYNAH